MQLLRRVLAKRPNYVDGWRSITDLALMTADFDAGSEGVEHLQAIYAEQPDPGVVSDIMLALQRMERYAEAAEYASRATRDFPGSVGVAYQAHRALLWAGKIEAAAALMPVLAEDQPHSTAIASVRQACAEGRRSDAERIAADFLSTLDSPELETVTWHLHMLLGRIDAANEVIRQVSSPDVLYSQAAWLFYRQFDPAPFPELVALLERERVERKPTLQVPFACP
jgi:tetratricopeptide (TPR) repeat protein